MVDANFLNKIEQIMARATSQALQFSVRRTELIIDEKSAGQFVSDADVMIERQLRKELSELSDDVHIIGEETGGQLSTEASGWALDPIDGTSNFLRGLPMWGISAGYLDQGRSVLGAIALPELGIMLSAADGNGLRVNQLPVQPTPRLSSIKLMALGENDFESGLETDQRAESLRKDGYAVVRYRCAVFSLASAALGRLDGYIENGCGLWDIAAATVICREAGMIVQSSRVKEGRYRIEARWPS